jgi:CelD/BcsL family acetyltransferase involved in cellulose biosynthesis
MVASHLSVSTVSTREAFQALEEPWNRLLTECQSDTYFLRWEWLWSWWQTFGAAVGTLHILVVKRGGRIVGIGPFYRTTATMRGLVAVRRILFLGTASGSNTGDVGTEYLDLIVHPQQGREIAQAMFRHLSQAKLCEELFLFHVPAQSTSFQYMLEEALAAGYWKEELQRWECPYIRLPDSWPVFLESLGSTLRYKFRKNLRELDKHGEHIFRITSAPEDLERDLRELVSLHQARWEGRGMSGVFADQKYHRFLQMVSGYALKHGHLRLSVVTVSGKPVAAVFNVAYGNKIYYYQSGFDTTFDKKVAIGTFAHTLCLERAIAEKLEEYDFLLKGSLDTYKDRWTEQVREIVDYRLVAPGWPRLLARGEAWTRQVVRGFRRKAS